MGGYRILTLLIGSPVGVSTGRLPLLVPKTETPLSPVLLVVLVLESVLDIGLMFFS